MNWIYLEFFIKTLSKKNKEGVLVKADFIKEKTLPTETKNEMIVSFTKKCDYDKILPPLPNISLVRSNHSGKWYVIDGFEWIDIFNKICETKAKIEDVCQNPSSHNHYESLFGERLVRVLSVDVDDIRMQTTKEDIYNFFTKTNLVNKDNFIFKPKTDLEKFKDKLSGELLDEFEKIETQFIRKGE